jgi:hypothetical protein
MVVKVELMNILLFGLLLTANADVTPSKFKFDTTISGEDNWGIPGEGRTHPSAQEKYYDSHIRDKCIPLWKENEKPMSELLKTATAIHSKDTPLYDAFKSTDLVPENKHLYGKMAPWGKEGKFNFNSVLKRSMMAANCHLEEDDGSSWEITRVGPFYTKGAYDWLQLGWDDIWGMEKILDAHKDGVYIVEQVMSPVLADGTRLGNPPIHIHHIHVGPDYTTYVRQRTDAFRCALKNQSCFNPVRTMEVHGDYECTDDEGGPDCHVENFGKGWVNDIMLEYLSDFFSFCM